MAELKENRDDAAADDDDDDDDDGDDDDDDDDDDDYVHHAIASYKHTSKPMELQYVIGSSPAGETAMYSASIPKSTVCSFLLYTCIFIEIFTFVFVFRFI